MTSIVVFAAVCGTIALADQDRRGRIEAGGGVSTPLLASTQTYTSLYEPPFPFVPHSGEAGHELTLDPVRRAGVWGSLTWFAGPHVGLEIRAAFERVPIGGANDPYELSLSYETRQPPDYIPREHQLRQTLPWPDTEGHVDHLAFSGSVVGVLGDLDALSLRLSGGLALTSTSGRFGPLGFSMFQLGGHSVVFSNEYRLRMRIERTWVAGFEGGAEVTRAVGSRMMLTAGVRLRFGPPTRGAVSVAQVSAESAVQPLAPADAEAVLAPAPFEWDPARVTLLAGVRIRL